MGSGCLPTVCQALLSTLQTPPLILIAITQGQREPLLTQVTTWSLGKIKGLAHICTAVKCPWEEGYESRLCDTETHASEFYGPHQCLLQTSNSISFGLRIKIMAYPGRA